MCICTDLKATGSHRGYLCTTFVQAYRGPVLSVGWHLQQWPRHFWGEWHFSHHWAPPTNAGERTESTKSEVWTYYWTIHVIPQIVSFCCHKLVPQLQLSICSWETMQLQHELRMYHPCHGVQGKCLQAKSKCVLHTVINFVTLPLMNITHVPVEQHEEYNIKCTHGK